jgi:hypothetical protein
MATFAKSAGLYLVKEKLTTLAGHFRFAIHRETCAVVFMLATCARALTKRDGGLVVNRIRRFLLRE